MVCEEGDLAGARILWDGIFPVCDLIENNPYASGVKAALQLIGLDMGEPRRPAQPLERPLRTELAARMRNMGLPVVG